MTYVEDVEDVEAMRIKTVEEETLLKRLDALSRETINASTARRAEIKQEIAEIVKAMLRVRAQRN